MSNYATLKAAVQAVVKSNGNKEITGTNMQSTLLGMITSLASGYLFKGVATTSTSPGTPDENVFYVGGAGTYENFGTSYTVPVGSIGVFRWNGSWSRSRIDISKDSVYYIENSYVQELIGESQLASHINIPSICAVRDPSTTGSGIVQVSDLPEAGAWVLVTQRYSSNYNLQEIIGINDSIRGKRYTRMVHRTNYTISHDWALDFGKPVETSVINGSPNPISSGAIYDSCLTYLTDAVRNPIIAESLLATHINIPSICMVNNNAAGTVTDMPSSDAWILKTYQYGGSYNIQEAIGFRDGNRGERYTRMVHRTNYTITRDWELDNSLTLVKTNYKILGFGDSIMRGLRNGEKGFLYLLTNDYLNKGVSGSTIASGTKTIQTQIDDYADSFVPEIVIMNGGTNDYNYGNGAGKPLGTLPVQPVTTDSQDASLDKTTVYGGLQHIFYQVIKRFPAANRLFVMVHQMRDWTWTANGQGYTFKELAENIKKICNLYNVYYVDVFNDSIINTAFSQYYAVIPWEDAPDKEAWNAVNYVDNDQVHPADHGYRTGYAPLILSAINKCRNRYML